MIILPVEKRLNLNKPPIVLFAIVLINVLIFFFYQLNDTEKYQKALMAYDNEALISIEADYYDDYLQLPKNADKLKQLQTQIDYKDSYDDIEFDMFSNEQQIYKVILLQDKAFFKHLEKKPHLFENQAQYNQWHKSRLAVNKFISQASSVKFALIPAEKRWLTFISHQFMHGNLLHLLGNMFFLVMCGFAVEAAIGHWRFLLFYLLGGIAGGVGHMLSNPESSMPLVGASGAISAVMAMYLGVFRFKKIEFFYWLYIFVGYFRAPALLILGLYIGKEVYEYTNPNGQQVAYMAHVGGFIGGFILMLAVLLFSRDILDDDYIEEDDSIDPSQAQQAKILNAIEKLNFSNALKLLDHAIANAEEDDPFVHENTLLKAKLLFLLKHENADNFAMQVLSQKKAAEHELPEFVTLWKKITHKIQTAPEARLKAGLQFCTYSDIRIAESIFKSLMAQKYNDSRMSVLAGRIAYFYQQQNQTTQAQHYQQLSAQLSSNHTT